MRGKLVGCGRKWLGRRGADGRKCGIQRHPMDVQIIFIGGVMRWIYWRIAINGNRNGLEERQSGRIGEINRKYIKVIPTRGGAEADLIANGRHFLNNKFGGDATIQVL